MNLPEAIDLHIHSTVSDGTETPEELLRCVREAGIALFSLTDHDAIQGCARIQAVRRPDDPAFLPGVEFSCRDEAGKYHILGYGYDPNTAPIQSAVAFGHSLRMKKVRMRLDFLKDRFSFDFPPEEIRSLLALDNPGKPHIGNLMVKLGFAETKEKAIRDYIDQLRIPTDYIRPEQAIQGILASGGIPVLAHPCYGSGDELIVGEELEQRICKLMDFGLLGVEAYYSGFSKQLRAQVLALAERYELYVTAGSDYHGRNKLVSLGDTGMDCETPPAGLLRFLQAVGAAPFDSAADRAL